MQKKRGNKPGSGSKIKTDKIEGKVEKIYGVLLTIRQAEGIM